MVMRRVIGLAIVLVASGVAYLVYDHYRVGDVVKAEHDRIANLVAEQVPQNRLAPGE
jgi:predicted type IV restriction endonuclease